MANLIQIKRSLNTAVPGSLANGELAYTANGDTLYVGSNGNVVAIAGKRVPGTLTANQALVANSTSYLDVIKTANLYIGAATVNQINAVANTTHLGAAANNELTTTWAVKTYVDSSISYTVTNNSTNTQVLFNNSGVVAGDAGMTYNSTTDTLSITNISGNGASVTSVDAATVGGNTAGDLRSYSDTMAGTAYSNAMSTTLSRNGSYTGNNTFGGTNTVFTSNVTVSGTINRNPVITLAGDLSGSVTLTDLGSGTLTATIVADSVALGTDTTGNYVSTITAGDGISGSSSSEGGTPTIAVVANNGLVSNSSGVFVKTGTGVSIDGNGNVAIGQAVSTTSDVTFRNLTITGNTVLGDASGDNISFTGSVNTSIIPSANITYNLGTDSLRWNEIHASNVHSTTGYFDGSVSIAGNLNVSGNLVTTNVSSVIVSDPLIYLAGNNYSSDLVDIGFAGNYYDTGTSTSRHAGLFRDASDGIFKLFYNTSEELDVLSVINTSNPDYLTASLQAYLVSGGLVSNTTVVNITANSTVSSAIVANTLSLSTALAGTSGGTGKATMTNNAILVGNSTNGYNELVLGTSGYVLQSNGTALVYDTLDGGSF